MPPPPLAAALSAAALLLCLAVLSWNVRTHNDGRDYDYDRRRRPSHKQQRSLLVEHTAPFVCRQAMGRTGTQEHRSHRCGDGTLWRWLTQVDIEEILVAMAGRLGISDGDSVFEAGSGCGSGLGFLQRRYRQRWPSGSGIYISGVDISEGALAYARNTYRDNATFCYGDITEPMSFIPTDTYDLSFSYGVFGYLDPPKSCAAIRELVRITKPGGGIFLNTQEPDCPSYTWGIGKWRRLWRRCLRGLDVKMDVVPEFELRRGQSVHRTTAYCPHHTTTVFIRKSFPRALHLPPSLRAPFPMPQRLVSGAMVRLPSVVDNSFFRALAKLATQDVLQALLDAQAGLDGAASGMDSSRQRPLVLVPPGSDASAHYDDDSAAPPQWDHLDAGNGGASHQSTARRLRSLLRLDNEEGWAIDEHHGAVGDDPWSVRVDTVTEVFEEHPGRIAFEVHFTTQGGASVVAVFEHDVGQGLEGGRHAAGGGGGGGGGHCRPSALNGVSNHTLVVAGGFTKEDRVFQRGVSVIDRRDHVSVLLFAAAGEGAGATAAAVAGPASEKEFGMYETRWSRDNDDVRKFPPASAVEPLKDIELLLTTPDGVTTAVTPFLESVMIDETGLWGILTNWPEYQTADPNRLQWPIWKPGEYSLDVVDARPVGENTGVTRQPLCSTHFSVVENSMQAVDEDSMLRAVRRYWRTSLVEIHGNNGFRHGGKTYLPP